MDRWAYRLFSVTSSSWVIHLQSKFQDPSPNNSVRPDGDHSEIIDHNDFKNKSKPSSTQLEDVQSQSMNENDVRSIYNSIVELLLRSALMDTALQDITTKLDRVQAAMATSPAVERDVMSTVVRASLTWLPESLLIYPRSSASSYVKEFFK